VKGAFAPLSSIKKGSTKMTNYEKIKLIAKHLQFMLDEGLIDEEHCGTVKEEIYSTMEILSDCDSEYEEAFKEDLKELGR
jgi:hypothetical protein